jgi:hypothetical protein
MRLPVGKRNSALRSNGDGAALKVINTATVAVEADGFDAWVIGFSSNGNGVIGIASGPGGVAFVASEPDASTARPRCGCGLGGLQTQRHRDRASRAAQ